MLSPVLLKNKAFDATQPFTFRFDWRGNQAFGSTLVIKNNDTDVVVSNTTVTTMKLEHTLPANILTNGVCYKAFLTVRDANNQIISNPSNTIRFYCYSTPTFEFTNVEEGQRIENSAYEVTLSYSQDEGESIKEYWIKLYDLGHAEVFSSGTKYATGSDITISQYISGLTDNSQYFLKAAAVTQNGMEVDTGEITIIVDYLNPPLFTPLEATNNADRGYITLASHAVTIEGIGAGDYSYIDGTKIDLTNEGASVTYQDINFPDNWKIDVVYNQIEPDVVLIQMQDATEAIQLRYREGRYRSNNNMLKGFLELRVGNAMGTSIYCSNYVAPIHIGEFHVSIMKQDGIYQVVLTNNGDEPIEPIFLMTYSERIDAYMEGWEALVMSFDPDLSYRDNMVQSIICDGAVGASSIGQILETRYKLPAEITPEDIDGYKYSGTDERGTPFTVTVEPGAVLYNTRYEDGYCEIGVESTNHHVLFEYDGQSVPVYDDDEEPAEEVYVFIDDIDPCMEYGSQWVGAPGVLYDVGTGTSTTLRSFEIYVDDHTYILHDEADTPVTPGTIQYNAYAATTAQIDAALATIPSENIPDEIINTVTDNPNVWSLPVDNFANVVCVDILHTYNGSEQYMWAHCNYDPETLELLDTEIERSTYIDDGDGNICGRIIAIGDPDEEGVEFLQVGNSNIYAFYPDLSISAMMLYTEEKPIPVVYRAPVPPTPITCMSLDTSAQSSTNYVMDYISNHLSNPELIYNSYDYPSRECATLRDSYIYYGILQHDEREMSSQCLHAVLRNLMLCPKVVLPDGMSVSDVASWTWEWGYRPMDGDSSIWYGTEASNPILGTDENGLAALWPQEGSGYQGDYDYFDYTNEDERWNGALAVYTHDGQTWVTPYALLKWYAGNVELEPFDFYRFAMTDLNGNEYSYESEDQTYVDGVLYHPYEATLEDVQEVLNNEYGLTEIPECLSSYFNESTLFFRLPQTSLLNYVGISVEKGDLDKESLSDIAGEACNYDADLHNIDGYRVNPIRDENDQQRGSWIRFGSNVFNLMQIGSSNLVAFVEVYPDSYKTNSIVLYTETAPEIIYMNYETKPMYGGVIVK